MIKSLPYIIVIAAGIIAGILVVPVKDTGADKSQNEPKPSATKKTAFYDCDGVFQNEPCSVIKEGARISFLCKNLATKTGKVLRVKSRKVGKEKVHLKSVSIKKRSA